MGRGIFATQDIPAYTLIHQADFLKIKESEVDQCPTISKYVFAYTKKYVAFCLGVGSLFNHADDPTVDVYIAKKDGRDIFEFWTLHNVSKGEELFTRYGGEEYAYYHLLKKKKK